MLGASERKRSGGGGNGDLSLGRRPPQHTVITVHEPPRQSHFSSSSPSGGTGSNTQEQQQQQARQQQHHLQQQQQLQHRRQLALMQRTTLQDFIPVLFEAEDATAARDAFSWLVPEFHPTEAEDEFALFNQHRRQTTFLVVATCTVVFLPATIARMTEDSGSCRDAACILGLVSQLVWFICVGVLGYLLRQHVRYTRLFAYHKNTVRSVGNRANQQATSPEAFAHHTLDAVLPALAASPPPAAAFSLDPGASDAVGNLSMAGNPSLQQGQPSGAAATSAPTSSAILMNEFRRSSITLDADGPSSPSIAHTTAVVMDERHKYLAQARQRMRLHATMHEIACGCALAGFLGHALAFLAERENCVLGVTSLEMVSQKRACEGEVQLEASFLMGALLTASGLVPIRMTLMVSFFTVSTAFLMLSWWYLRPRVAENITAASHGVFTLACCVAVLTAMWRVSKRERHMRAGFKKLCDIQTTIAQLANLRQHTGSLVGPAIPPDIAKVVAARQELFDYSGDAAVLCVGIRDLSIVAADASCSEVTEFLQRWFLVLDSIKLCFPRCFKIHCFGDRYMVVAGWEQYLPNEEKDKMAAATMAENQKAVMAATEAMMGGGGGRGSVVDTHQQLRDMMAPDESSMFLDQPTLLVSPPPAPILIVQTPSAEFSPDQPASNPALKARWNTECVYGFGILLARILQPDFFERLWCTVRGVYWTPSATPRFRDEAKTVSVAISADIGRAAGVLLAGTTLSYVAVGDAVSRCQRLVNNAPSSGFFVSHEFQRCLGFAVDPYLCTVMPDETQKSAIERELESSLGVNLWNAPVLQSIGESMDDNGAGGEEHHQVLGAANTNSGRRRVIGASATSPQEEGVALANSGRSQNPNQPLIKNSSSLAIAGYPQNPQAHSSPQNRKRSSGAGNNSPADDFVSPLPSPSIRNPLVGPSPPVLNTTPGGTNIPPPSPQQQQQQQSQLFHQQTLTHSSSNPLQNTSSGTTLLHTTSSSRSQTSQQILEMIHKELEVNPFEVEGGFLDAYRFTNETSERLFTAWVVKPSAKRREEFIAWFLLCGLASLVYLASTLIFGANLVPIPSAASLFLLSAIVAALGTVFSLLWYPTLLSDWILYLVGAVHHIAVMAGFFHAITQDDSRNTPSSSRAVLLWLLTHVIMVRLPTPSTISISIDIAMDAVWSLPFIVLTGVAYATTTQGVDRVPNPYLASHVIAEAFVCGLIVFSRAKNEETKRNTYAIAMRLKDLEGTYNKDLHDLRKLLERLVHNKDVVDELLPAFVQRQQQQQHRHRQNSRGSRSSGSGLGASRSARDTMLNSATPHGTNPIAPSTFAVRNGNLIGAARETAFLICTMAFNGNTPMPKRSSRRAQAMHQMKPILKPMWKFYGQLEETLSNHPECAGATVVKTNGDMILFTPKSSDRTSGSEGGDTPNDESVNNNTGTTAPPRSARAAGALSMMECALALYQLGASVSGVEMRLVLSCGPLSGAILGSCALSMEYYGASAFIAYELTQRALPRVVATDTFLRVAPSESIAKSTKWQLGSPQNERIQQYGFVRVVPIVFKQAPTLDGSRRSTTTGLPKF